MRVKLQVLFTEAISDLDHVVKLIGQVEPENYAIGFLRSKAWLGLAMIAWRRGDIAKSGDNLLEAERLHDGITPSKSEIGPFRELAHQIKDLRRRLDAAASTSQPDTQPAR